MEQFCLKWNNFQSSIVTAFESLQSTEDLADVTLTCEGLNVKAHKIILSACSPYFRTVFKENPCSHPIIILKDVLHVDLLAILNFMYHGEVLVAQDQLTSFLQTAELLQVSGLIGSENIPNKNCSGFLEHAKLTKSKTSELHGNPKKAKVTSKIKQAKLISTIVTPKTNENFLSISNIQKVLQTSSPPRDTFEVVNVDTIKRENERFEEEHDFNENVDFNINNEKSHQQCSILEAALEIKDTHSSILERSLTSVSVSGKSPSVTYPLEHVAILQDSSPEPTKLVNVPKKSSESLDNEKKCVKHKIMNTTESATFDLTVESLPKNIKLEEEAATVVEINRDSIQSLHGDISIHSVRTLSDVQPHHSSQCGNCPHCGKVYSNQSALKYHVRLVHSDLTNMYCCHLCPESFDYREGYKKHMVEVHSIKN